MARVVGRADDALLIRDGPAGAVVQPGRAPVLRSLSSLVAHGDWEPVDEPVPADVPAVVLDQLAAARQSMAAHLM